MLRYESTATPPARPYHLRFGLLSAEEIRRMAVVCVTETTLYYRGLPNSRSLMDPLMGSVDRRHLCASCQHDARTCQGHIGYIELAWPVYHVGFVDVVLKILRSTCFACSRVCATDDDVQSMTGSSAAGKARLWAFHAATKGRKTCPHCDMVRPSYTRTR